VRLPFADIYSFCKKNKNKFRPKLKEGISDRIEFL
jgi:hypothetical protein